MHDLTAFTAETLTGAMRIEVVHQVNSLTLVLNGMGYILPPDRKVLLAINVANSATATTLKVDAKVLD